MSSKVAERLTRLRVTTANVLTVRERMTRGSSRFPRLQGAKSANTKIIVYKTTNVTASNGAALMTREMFVEDSRDPSCNSRRRTINKSYDLEKKHFPSIPYASNSSAASEQPSLRADDTSTTETSRSSASPMCRTIPLRIQGSFTDTHDRGASRPFSRNPTTII